jgi:hypothetical protein
MPAGTRPARDPLERYTAALRRMTGTTRGRAAASSRRRAGPGVRSADVWFWDVREARSRQI